MAELDNARRSIDRATYTPIKADRPHTPAVGRAVAKWSYFAALAATGGEVERVLKRLAGEGPLSEDDRKHFATIEAAVADPPEAPSGSQPLRMMPDFAPIPARLLARFGAALLEVRRNAVNGTLESHGAILDRYEQAMRRRAGGPAGGRPAVPRGFEADADFVLPGVPGAKAFRFATGPEPLPGGAAARASARARPAEDATGRQARAGGLLTRPPIETAPPPTTETTPILLGTLMRWAIDERVAAQQAEDTLDLATRLGVGPTQTLAEYRRAVQAWVGAVQDLNFAFEQQVEIEPVGMLHLERMSFIPAGIERGELQHSVPLSPAEQVNISHKEWSNTSEEFERIVTDFLEAFSEEGVTEKSELSQSTASQQEHSSGFNLSVSASGSYGPVSVSTAVGYNVSDSASRSQETARKQSSELTRKASSRVKKEHKVSFKVASASGTEDQAVRLIKNPFDDRSTRVDYYQLIRKWRVDLYRYGLRMTYDLTIPEPGSDILSKIVELKSLTAALGEGFGGSGSTLPWARFDLTPQGVTRGNYLGLAAQYGVAVEPPPPAERTIAREFTGNWPNKDAASDDEYATFDVDVPDGYVVTAFGQQWAAWVWESEAWHFDVGPDLHRWLGVGGRLTLVAGTRYVSAFHIHLKLTFGLEQAAYEAWKQRVWGALREAAEARYELNRTMLKGRLAQLQEELGAQDALSLRQIEREEVMKHVLRWLFGPSFSFVPPGLPANLYGSTQTVIDDATWAEVLAQGEVIKFLHHAIEWENMLFFLYPYFWSHTSRWELKKVLDHPDFLHRTFLKSGAARVVLTIRPGFETDFVSFVETGGFGGLPPTHPYMTIAMEMEAFARTNYPGIRAANPIENTRPLLTPLQQRAWTEMQGIIALLEQHKESHGAYPTTAQGLAALAPLGTVPSSDPWGNDFAYRSPGAFTDFELSSFGADGAPGGEGEDADITSWAEASLIGRWYEYTPTSALDIAFDETMPTA